MIIIIFLLTTLQKVLSYSIKENTFSDRLLNTNSFYSSNYFTYSNFFQKPCHVLPQAIQRWQDAFTDPT